MKGLRGVIAATALGTAVVAGSPAAALAFDGTPGDFGQMVAMCANAHLGQRATAPTVTCTCADGTTMTFANFAEMVVVMQGSTCTNCC